MATNPNATQITPPRVPIIDTRTGAVSREWYRWFYSLYNIVGGGLGVVPIASGGTGLSTIPTNGQLLIGNGTGYTLNTLGTGVGISATNGSGTITLANTGVLSNIAGSGISVSSATGDVSINNTGVLSFSGGTTGLTPSVNTTGVVILAGTLAIANGGTNGSSTPTAGAVPYGTGTAYAFTAAGSAGQVLTSAGAGVPTWTTPTTGTITSVSFTGGIITVATPTTTPALTVAGTSGGVVYFSSNTTWASSAALTANALMVGGGAGAAPSTVTTGTGVVTALGVNTGTAGAFVVNNGALGTPSSGTVTNLTGTASININGTVGATTPAAASVTTATITATPSSNWGIDFAPSTSNPNYITLAAAATYDIAAGSGLVVIHSNTTGDAALFLTYGGVVIKIGGAASIVSGTGGASQIGLVYNSGAGKYRINNGYATSQSAWVTTIRTRTTS